MRWEDQALVLPRIYDCATSRDHWEDAIDALVEQVGARGGIVAAQEDNLLPFALSKSSLLYRNHAGEMQFYQQNFFEYERQAAAFLAQAEHGQICRDIDVWPDWDNFKGRPDIVWCRETIGIFRKAGVRLNKNRAWFDAVLIAFDAKYDELPPLSLRTLSAFIPHLAKAIELNRFFSVLIEKYNAVLAVLDRVRIGIVIIEPGGCVIATNNEAQRLLQMGEGVALARNDHLICRDDDLTRSLDDAIRKASSTARGRHKTPETLMAIPRRSGRRPLLLEIIPLRDSKAEIERDFTGAMVAIIDPDKPRLFDASILGKAYRLTQAEQDVCKLMVEGLMVVDIAEARNVAPDTVKTQIKSIYSKINASSRTELIRLILSACPPIDIA